MAFFDFPNNPTVGQMVTGSNGAVYRWDGVKWVAAGGGGGAFLPLTGGQIYNPGNSDPLVIQADLGQYSRIRFGILGNYDATIGLDSAGTFGIWNGPGVGDPDFYVLANKEIVAPGYVRADGGMQVYQAGQSDPLTIQADGGLYSRVRFGVLGVGEATMGLDSDGNIGIWSGPGSGTGILWVNAASGHIECNSSVLPLQDNTYDCGWTGAAWQWGYFWNIWSPNPITTSDRNRKRDIQTAPQDALLHINQVQPMRYRLEKASDDAPLHWGFIAQDVREVMGDDFGGCCRNPETGEEGLNYNNLVAVLWRGVQELAAEVEALKAQRR